MRPFDCMPKQEQPYSAHIVAKAISPVIEAFLRITADYFQLPLNERAERVSEKKSFN